VVSYPRSYRCGPAPCRSAGVAAASLWLPIRDMLRPPVWPPGDAALRVRNLTLAVLLFGIAPPVFAQPAATVPPGWVPPGANPTTGARPGNEIGTGMSLPTSDQSGNITPADTASPIAARLPEPPVADNAAIHDYLLAARN